MTTVRSLPEFEATPHATVFPGSEPRVIRLALDAGQRVAPHRHPGRAVVFALLDGAVTLEVGGERFDLAAGDLARFDGEREVSPAATEPSTALVVLAEKRGDDGPDA